MAYNQGERGGAASRNPKSRENKTQGSKRDAAPHSREKQRDRPKEILLFAGRAQPVQEMTVSTSEVEASEVIRTPPKNLRRGCRIKRGVRDRPSSSGFVYTHQVKRSGEKREN